VLLESQRTCGAKNDGHKKPGARHRVFKIFGDSERVSDTQTETGLAFVGIFHAHIADFDIR
jgi:hypothetical protein